MNLQRGGTVAGGGERVSREESGGDYFTREADSLRGSGARIEKDVRGFSPLPASPVQHGAAPGYPRPPPAQTYATPHLRHADAGRVTYSGGGGQRPGPGALRQQAPRTSGLGGDLQPPRHHNNPSPLAAEAPYHLNLSDDEGRPVLPASPGDAGGGERQTTQTQAGTGAHLGGTVHQPARSPTEVAAGKPGKTDLDKCLDVFLWVLCCPCMSLYYILFVWVKKPKRRAYLRDRSDPGEEGRAYSGKVSKNKAKKHRYALEALEMEGVGREYVGWEDGEGCEETDCYDYDVFALQKPAYGASPPTGVSVPLGKTDRTDYDVFAPQKPMYDSGVGAVSRPPHTYNVPAVARQQLGRFNQQAPAYGQTNTQPAISGREHGEGAPGHSNGHVEPPSRALAKGHRQPAGGDKSVSPQKGDTSASPPAPQALPATAPARPDQLRDRYFLVVDYTGNATPLTSGQRRAQLLGHAYMESHAGFVEHPENNRSRRAAVCSWREMDSVIRRFMQRDAKTCKEATIILQGQNNSEAMLFPGAETVPYSLAILQSKVRVLLLVCQANFARGIRRPRKVRLVFPRGLETGRPGLHIRCVSRVISEDESVDLLARADGNAPGFTFVAD